MPTALRGGYFDEYADACTRVRLAWNEQRVSELEAQLRELGHEPMPPSRDMKAELHKLGQRLVDVQSVQTYRKQ